MAINLYSKDSVDDLLDAKLSDAPVDGSTYGRKDAAWEVISASGLTISSLSNAATATLNAGVPTAGQALTYDGTDLIWATVSGSYLPLEGGTVTGPIIVDESATSGFTSTLSGAQLSFDGTGCYISGEETTIYGFNSSNVGSITFSDSTTQTTAAVAPPSVDTLKANAIISNINYFYGGSGTWVGGNNPVPSVAASASWGVYNPTDGYIAYSYTSGTTFYLASSTTTNANLSVQVSGSNSSFYIN